MDFCKFHFKDWMLDFTLGFKVMKKILLIHQFVTSSVDLKHVLACTFPNIT